MAVVTAAAPAYLWHSQSQSRSGRAHSPQAGHPPTCRWAWARQHPSPSELNAPTPAASKRSASFFFKAKIGVFVPFSAAYARWLMPVNRALKSARAPCALFAALEAKHHHHPQLARRCTSPPPVPRSVPATRGWGLGGPSPDITTTNCNGPANPSPHHTWHDGSCCATR
jgi:hypothetical protein